MTYAILLYAAKGAIAVGAVATSVYFGVRHARDGQCDEAGEYVAPAKPLGVLAWALIGLCLWLPFLPLLFLTA